MSLNSPLGSEPILPGLSDEEAAEDSCPGSPRGEIAATGWEKSPGANYLDGLR